MRTVVLVDVFGVREPGPLTFPAVCLTLVIDGAVLRAVLAAVIMGTQQPSTLEWMQR